MGVWQVEMVVTEAGKVGAGNKGNHLGTLMGESPG